MPRPLAALVVALCLAAPASAQTKPAPPPPQPGAPKQPAPPAKPPAQTRPAAAANPNPIRPRAFVTFGGVSFQAQDTFDAIFESHRGPTFGGGGQVLLPWGLYAEVSAWRFTRDGERAFVGPNREVFRLGIPVQLTITPIELTGGWRYRHCPGPPRKPGAPRPPQVLPARPCNPRLVPYAGGGFSSYRYTESSDFAEAGENVDERFNGFHLVGGAEYRVMRWVAVGGEVAWSSVADALGAGGVSAALDENNLGGTLFRLKITVGR